MVTVENSLQLYNQMPPALERVNRSIQIVVFAMGDMEQAFRRPIDVTPVVEAETQLDKARSAAEQLGKTWKSMSGALKTVGISLNTSDIFSNADKLNAAGNTVQAQTGMQGQDLDMAKESTKNLYVDNMGTSMEDTARSLSTVHQMTGLAGAGLEQMTRAGLLLRDTYGYGVADSVRTAEMLQRQFGVSGAQAYDLIIQGTQAGLNRNGDFLKVLDQYSSQFQKLGFDSAGMFDMLINGSEGGIASVSQIGDAVKEFSARTAEGGTSAQEGFRAIGLDAGQMAAALGSGGETARQAFQQTVAAISAMDDPVQQNIAGANLFGNAWKNLGADGMMAMASLNGSTQLTSDHLEQLNSVRYNDATSALSSLARTVNTGLAGAVGDTVNRVAGILNDFTTGLQGKTGEVQGIFGGIGLIAGWIGNTISDGWSIIEPILWGIIAALAIYNGYLLITNGVKALSTIIQFAYAAATGIAASSTAAETAAQLGLNAAFLSCPITWIILGIIALIAVFYAVIAAVNHFAGTSISATGVICGAFSTAVAFIKNVLMGLLTIGLGVVEFLVNLFSSFGNFIGNFLTDPVGSTIRLFADMGDAVLGIIEKIAQAIDFVFGSNFAGTVAGWREGLSEMANAAAEKMGNGKYEEKYEKFNVDQVMADMGITLERTDYGDAYDSGYQFGQGVDDKVGNSFDALKDKFGSFEEMEENSDIPAITDGIYNNTGSTASNTAAMANEMGVMDEDLKYMRDAAEQEIINRFTLAELKVDMNNNNTLKSEMDMDLLVGKLNGMTNEILQVAAEGAF